MSMGRFVVSEDGICRWIRCMILLFIGVGDMVCLSRMKIGPSRYSMHVPMTKDIIWNIREKKKCCIDRPKSTAHQLPAIQFIRPKLQG